eukprot:contig_18503_g4549
MGTCHVPVPTCLAAANNLAGPPVGWERIRLVTVAMANPAAAVAARESSHPLVVAVVSLVVLLAALANPAAPAAVRERSRPLVVAVVSVVVLLAALANPAAPAALRERSRPLVVAVVNLVVLLAGLADPAAATAAQERSRLVVVAMVSPRELPEMWRFNQVLVVVQGLLMEFLMVWTGSCSLGRLAFLLHPLLRMAPVVLLELVPPATSQALIAVCL